MKTSVVSVLLVAMAITGTRAAAVTTTNETSMRELKKLSLEQLMSVEVGTVTTVSKVAEKATAAPATVIVIDKRDIKLRGYRFLYDVLRDLPGMEIAPMFFSEIGTQVPVRGVVGNNKIIVLVNGMRVNPPGGENFPLRSDFSIRNAEQIEVMYGAASTLYGQDAISAVINIKTRGAGDKASGELGADGGLNSERDAWASYNDAFGPNKNIRLSTHIAYHDSNLGRFDQDYPTYWSSYRNIADATSPSGLGQTPWREDFGLNIFTRVDFNDLVSLQVWHRQSERSSSEGGYGYSTNGQYTPVLHYLEEAKWGDMSTVVEGKITLPIGDSLKLDSIVTYNRYEIDPNTRYVWPAGNNWYFNDYKYGIGQGLTLEETLRWDISSKLSLLTGFTAGMFDVIPKSTVPGGANTDGSEIAQGGFWEYYTANGNLASIQRIPRVVRVCYQTYAVYAEMNWQMLEQLRLTAGTRLTKDTRFSQLPVTPRIALVYDVTKEWAAKYIFTRAYVAPAPYFSYATYDNGTLLATSNPGISPETSTTHEINLTYTKKNLQLGLSVYYGEQENLILVSDRAAPQNIIQQVWVGPTATDPRWLVHSANGGTSTRIGSDLYGRATFGPVSGWASYSYVDFHEENGALMTGPAGISRHNGRLGLTWAPTSRLFITPSLVVRSTPVNVLPGVLGSAMNNPMDVNLYVLWNASKHVDVFADFRNITNTRNALGGVAGWAYPQETFQGTIGVRLSY